MTIRIPTSRLAQPGACRYALSKPSSAITLPYHTRRTLSSSPTLHADESNPILADYYRKEAERNKRGVTRPSLSPGSLPPDSIFGTEEQRIDRRRTTKGLSKEAKKQARKEDEDAEIEKAKQEFASRDKDLLATKLDPNPEARQAWERKMVIRSIRRRGKLTKPEMLMRTERQSLYKSPFLATSVKKLTKLANQITGKTIDEAIVQMRFSKKKVAREVLAGLKIARDEATVSRGMGLGVSDEEGKKIKQEPVEIELKDGRKRIIRDKTQVYIDQAWVGKGEITKSPDYRARGQMYILKHPSTSFSVVLKEEATRVREAKERQEKRDNKKVWTQLPDRPVTAQRQYCLW